MDNSLSSKNNQLAYVSTLASSYQELNSIHCYISSLMPMNENMKLQLEIVRNNWFMITAIMQEIESPSFKYDEHSVDFRVKLAKLISEFKFPNHLKSYYGDENIWIVKPVGLSCGEGIQVVAGVLSALKAMRLMNYKCVVQKYVERPLLIRKRRKFDIRQWILVTNVNPLIIFGFSECYVRMTSREYDTSSQNLSNPLVHLCNHAIQGDDNNRKTLSQEDEDPIATPVNPSLPRSAVYCDTMMTQDQFTSSLRAMAHPLYSGLPDPYLGHIFPQIQSLSITAVERVRDRLRKVGKGFEWLGLDFLVTADTWEVLLLEVNMSPDISPSTPVTERLVTPAVVDLLALILDENAAEDIGVSRILSGQSTRRIVSVRGGLRTTSDPHCSVSLGSVRAADTVSIRAESFNVMQTGTTDISVSTVAPVARSTEGVGRLAWDLWHIGEEESLQSLYNFSKGKEQKRGKLKKTYFPTDIHLAERLEECLTSAASRHNNDDEI